MVNIRKRVGLIVVIGVMIGLLLLYGRSQTHAADWTVKVDTAVLDAAAAGETEFLVVLADQADLSGANVLATKDEKGAYVYEQLTAVARQTQPALTAQLDQLGAEYRPYWIVNMVWVRGDEQVLEAMAQRDEVTAVYANPEVAMPDLPTASDSTPDNPETIEWNIVKVNADDVWAMGYTGQGVTIAGQDTGYFWSHTGLVNQYRGWNGSVASHDYNWHDSIHSGGGSCGADSPFPCDDHGHGTHTMGTMVGNDLDPSDPNWPASAINAVGMAPGAEWIGCRNMNVGDGSPATYSECYEWFIAPYPIGGTPMTDGDPTKAPDVINNSWGCPTSEGCTDPAVLLSVVQAVRAAGIVTVHSAGNEGSACSSVQTPAAIYDESFSVGAVNSTDGIASFSSRGPVSVDGSFRMKPDISAPGVSIRSTTRDGSYQGGWQGTSMAGPHVAGLVALIISANPSLAGNVDLIEQIVQDTAVPLTTAQLCGTDQLGDVPNNVYGWGRIDALAAVEMALQYDMPFALGVAKTASSDWIMAGDLLTYTLTITNQHPISATTSVVLSDTLPAHTTFYTATQPFLQNGDVISWETATLAAEATFQAQLVVQVDQDAPGDIVNAVYGASSADAPLTEGTPVITTLVAPYEMALSANSPEQVQPGTVLTYTFTISNPHPFAALHNVVLTSSIPAQTSFSAATQPYSLADDVRWERAVLNVGETWVVELGVLVSPSAAGTVQNVDYSVWSDEVTAVSGPPLITNIIRYIYLPVMLTP